MLDADVEKALEDEFLGGGEMEMGEDYFSARRRTTGLDEVERFLQSGDPAAPIDLSSGAKRAISKNRASLSAGAYASPVARQISPSSSSSSSSSSAAGTDDRPFHERMAEARRQYQKLTRERNAPKQQSWANNSHHGGAQSKRPARTNLARSYTFQAIGRPTATAGGAPAAKMEEPTTDDVACELEVKEAGMVVKEEQAPLAMNGKRRKMVPSDDGDEGKSGEEKVSSSAIDQGETAHGGDEATMMDEEAENEKEEVADDTQGTRQNGGEDATESKERVRKIVKGARHGKTQTPREKYSLLRIEGGVEESVMAGYMEDKKIVHLADIMRHRRADGFKNISGNWVTFGILVAKSAIREANKGNSKYMAWDLADLQGNLISLFLFGEAAVRFADETQADVFALLNPEIIDARGGMSLALTVTEATQVMRLGKAVDFGICSSVEDGNPCTAVVDTSVRKRCIYHMQSEYGKVRSSRGELNSVISSPASRTTLKDAKARAQNNMSRAIFYIDGLELQPLAYTASMAQRRHAFKQGKDDSGSELLASPEISALLKNSRDTAGARNLKRMLGISEQADAARSPRSVKLIKQRMKNGGGGHLGVLHPNHPLLMKSDEEWEQENNNDNKRETNENDEDEFAQQLESKKKQQAKRKAPEQEEALDIDNNAGSEEGPAKKRRRKEEAADGDGGGDGDDGAHHSTMDLAAGAPPRLARGYQPGDSISL